MLPDHLNIYNTICVSESRKSISNRLKWNVDGVTFVP